MTSPRAQAAAALTAAVAVVLGYAFVCKALLFRNLEYTGTDIYSMLTMSRSWFFDGRLFYENSYGNHAAVHNYYLTLLFSPLMLAAGVYGLFLVLGALWSWAAVALARSPALDTQARVALLAALLSPAGFFVLDDPNWGFHPELLYPPLVLLFVLALVERRRIAVVVAAVAILLLREDGALVLGGVLASRSFLQWLDAPVEGDERRRVLRRAAVEVGGCALVFVLGMALLWWLGRDAAAGQATAERRIDRAVGILWRTLQPGAAEGRRQALWLLLTSHAALAALFLLPFAARALGVLRLLALAAPVVFAGLLVSDAQYKFLMTLFPSRAGTMLSLVLGCGVLVGAARRDVRWPGLATTLLLVALSWAGQVAVLGRIDYKLGQRLDAHRLWSGRDSALSAFTGPQLQAWRCLAGQLPRGTPVLLPEELYPFFHMQTIQYQGYVIPAARPARLRVARELDTAPLLTAEAACAAPPIGSFRLAVDCSLTPVLKACGVLP